MKYLTLTIAFVFSVLIITAQDSRVFSKVIIKIEENTAEIIASLGIPFEGAFHSNAYLITELDNESLAKLTENNIDYDVLIENVTEYYIQRNSIPQQQSEKNYCTPLYDYDTPQYFELGSMGGFFTLDEIYTQMDSMQARFPALVSVRQPIDTILTHEGRAIFYNVISGNTDTSLQVPRIFFQSLVHAREPMGMQQLFFFKWYLLENYAGNAEIKYLLDNSELYFIPCPNPDGYEHNRLTNPNGGGMWRKNRRLNNSSSFGVDLNRNFGFMWGFNNTGSSPDPSSEVFRGTAAFSEPETQAIKWMCETHNPTLFLDYHTYSDVLLYPWGYMNIKSPDSTLYDVYSSYLTSENRFQYGTAEETIGYSANGGAFDWYYGEQTTKSKTIAWGPEAGNPVDGFWPAINRIEDISKDYVAMNLFTIRFALSFADVIDNTDNYIWNTHNIFDFDILRLGLDSGHYTVALHPIQNVISCGMPKSFSGMNLLETRNDTIHYELSNQLNYGDEVLLLLEVHNGHFSRFDTIRKKYGQAVIVFEDNFSSTQLWAGNWGLSQNNYASAPSSITDSPYGNYTVYSTNINTINQAVDLNGLLDAFVSFYAKWDIVKGYDFAQIQISTDNGLTWEPLCGKHTLSGTINQELGKPLYDGKSNGWVKEQISLNNWLGQTVKFRFIMKSNFFWYSADGFYLDDFRVVGLMGNPTAIEAHPSSHILIYPNPSSDHITIDSKTKQLKSIQLTDINGKTLINMNTTQYLNKIHTQHLPQGMYFIHITFEDNSKLVEKLAVTR
jgi:carboxypeptidase T